jgi:tripartite-type tricarboxylate transporter receptor subunit TctC
MHLVIRSFFAGLVIWAASLAHAQAWPEKPLRLIVPFPPGGGTDILGRVLAQKLGDSLGQPMVVENRPGAGGSIGADAAAKAPPNGYTFLLVSASYAVGPSLYKLPFDAVNDLVPVSLVATVPFALVAYPGLPASSVAEVIALAKSKPGEINYASSGNGSAPHLAGELFAMRAGVKLVHVPFKGGAPALTEVLGGRVQLLFSTITQALPHIRAGRLKVIGLSSRHRSEVLPDSPTLDESGLKGFDLPDWFGVLAPRGTPEPIVQRMSGEIARHIRIPELKARLAGEGFEPVGSTPAEFREALRKDIETFATVVKAAGVRIE